MKKDPVKVIPLEQIQLNEGQLDWLPKNPRQWTQTDIDRTKRSLDEDPDFMQERPILAVPGPEKNTFVAFCGNLRLTAARALGWPGAPVVVYRPEGISKEDRETIIRRAIKDNGSFGSWDTDELASWPVETFELEDWGVPEWITGGAGSAQQQGGGEGNNGTGPEQYGEGFSLPDGPKDPFRQVSFQLSDEMAKILLLAIKAVQYSDDFRDIAGDGEDINGNGVAAFILARNWLDSSLEAASLEDLEGARKDAEDLRLYLRDALDKSGKRAKDVDSLLGTNGMSGHYFGESQWLFPTRKAYEKMREIMSLDRDYFECKKIEMRFNLLTALHEYKKKWEELKK